MKALIIGGSGFVGKHLAVHLKTERQWEVAITKLPQKTTSQDFLHFDLDILDEAAVQKLLETYRPEVIFHLAAQSSVAFSWKNPQKTVEINILGSLRLLEAIRKIEHYTPRILCIGSAEEYGVPSGELPVREIDSIHPNNPYAITKATQNFFGTLYAKAYDMDIILVRAFNHFGPGQLPQFVLADFCRQVAAIMLGKREPKMEVGNLTVARDFTDVRDVVRAYGMLAISGRKGETYNVGSGRAIRLEELLKRIIAFSGREITVTVDPKRLRKTEVPIIRADIQKLQADTGWSPRYAIDTTLRDTLNDWLEQ